MRKVLRILGLLLGGLVVLAVVLYLAVTVPAVIDANQSKQDAVEEIGQALPDAREAVTEQHEQLRAGAGDATWSWVEIACRWGTNDAGWMVQDYVQECRLQAIDLVPADSRDGASCTEDEDAVRQRADVTSTVVHGPSETLEREWPSEFECPGDLVLHGSEDDLVVLEGERPDDLGDAPAWTVLRTTTPITSTVVGCHRWSLLFCDQPGDVALPEVSDSGT